MVCTGFSRGPILGDHRIYILWNISQVQSDVAALFVFALSLSLVSSGLGYWVAYELLSILWFVGTYQGWTLDTITGPYSAPYESPHVGSMVLGLPIILTVARMGRSRIC